IVLMSSPGLGCPPDYRALSGSEGSANETFSSRRWETPQQDLSNSNHCRLDVRRFDCDLSPIDHASRAKDRHPRPHSFSAATSQTVETSGVTEIGSSAVRDRC